MTDYESKAAAVLASATTADTVVGRPILGYTAGGKIIIDVLPDDAVVVNSIDWTNITNKPSLDWEVEARNVITTLGQADDFNKTLNSTVNLTLGVVNSADVEKAFMIRNATGSNIVVAAGSGVTIELSGSLTLEPNQGLYCQALSTTSWWCVGPDNA